MKTVSVSRTTLTEEHLVKSDDTYDIFEYVGKEIVESITALHAGKQTRGHYHNHGEYYHFQEPGLTLMVDGKEAVIDNECIVYIRPNMFHRVINRTDRTIPFLCKWRVADVNPTYYDENYDEVEKDRSGDSSGDWHKPGTI